MADDIKKLIEEAAKEAYDPRAKKCWPWSHDWTMWELATGGMVQSRRCTRCGLNRQRTTGGHIHHWTTIRSVNLFEHASDKLPTAIAYDQRCESCGEIRRKTLKSYS